MALESGTYIDDLNASNPPQSDSLTQAAGHLRLIKSILKASFPNIDGAVTGTPAQLNAAAAVAASGQYVPAGVLLDYAGASLPSGGYLWANGQEVSRTTYAALFAAIGTTYGEGNGSTTFNVPNCKDRYRVGKGDMGSTTDAAIIDSLLATTTLGATYDGEGAIDTITLVTDNIPAHTHSFSASGTTGSQSANHTHYFGAYTYYDGVHNHSFDNAGNTTAVSGGSGKTVSDGSSASTGNGGNHRHFVEGNTGVESASHVHSFSVSGTTGSSGSGTAFTVDILPPSIVVNVIIKT